MTEQTANVQSLPPNPLFDGINKYLVIILGIFILILLGLSGYIMFVKKASLIEQTTTTPSDTKEQQFTAPLQPGSKNPDVIANQSIFNEIKVDAKEEIGLSSSTKKYEGKVESINYNDSGEILLEITIADISTFFDNNHNPITTPMKLQYKRSLIDKISVGYVQGIKTIPLSIKDILQQINKNDTIIVKEEFKLPASKYEESITKIAITKLPASN